MTLTDEQRAKVDALVAEKVMGCKFYNVPSNDGIRQTQIVHPGETPYNGATEVSWDRWIRAWTIGVLPKYTTSGDAMLEVIEKMKSTHHYYELSRAYQDGDDHMAAFLMDHETGDGEVSIEWAKTAPEAICLASLSAVDVDWRAELGVKKEAE
jgi:hypothetical protein